MNFDLIGINPFSVKIAKTYPIIINDQKRQQRGTSRRNTMPASLTIVFKTKRLFISFIIGCYLITNFGFSAASLMDKVHT
jgi:hypothetical protein